MGSFRLITDNSPCRQQFPSWLPGDDVHIPSTFSDVSYRHDVCPSFDCRDGQGMIVYIDYINKKDRENEDDCRFHVWSDDDACRHGEEALYDGNDWEEVLKLWRERCPANQDVRQDYGIQYEYDGLQRSVTDLHAELLIQAYGRKYPEKIMSVLADADVQYNALSGKCEYTSYK